ncbi:MAG: GNAT family N-acetyltransferase [Prevotella sp.]|nr:GNAT family N-acetyltransferase [Prevotella sp.]
MKTIYQASLKDIPVIQGIARVTFTDTYHDIITPEQNDYMMEMMYSTDSLTRQMTVDHHTYLIACLDGKPVGYVSVQPLSEKEDGLDVIELQKIYVLPNLHGQHLGQFLFDEAVKFIKTIHPAPCMMELHVNRHNQALGFYEHQGMRKLRQGDYPIGQGFYMNDYIMGLELKEK